MLQRKIASRYAEALFDIAQQTGKMEAWEAELASLGAVLDSSPELYQVLTHPEIPLRSKETLLQRTFQGKISTEIFAVLLMLIRRGHEPDIDSLHENYLQRWNAGRQVIPVTVTSAVPLSESQAQALEQTLARRTGATIQLTRSVEPELLAGMVLTIGDHVVDASARTTLQELRAVMAGV